MVLAKTLLDLNQRLPARDEEFSKRSEQINQQLQLYVQKLEAHLDAADLLVQRLQATLGLVSGKTGHLQCCTGLLSFY
jgi:redox-regulated HSP33 family molecular chaperone